MFDSGSQLSYITPRARNALDLQTVDQKEIAIKVFGKTEETKTLDRVNICIKSRDSNLNIYMSTFVNNVCFPIEGQNINIAARKYPHLGELELADDNPGNLPLEYRCACGQRLLLANF